MLMLTCCGLGMVILKAVAPDRYKKLTKRCRKPVVELTGDSGRGSVGDQLRAILAEQYEKKDVFAEWDKDGGGEVSRKEFRLWWPKIGYDAPTADIDDLFDEFDLDGSGEIDADEFKENFATRGKLWKELADIQKQNDESDAIHKMIVEIEGKITKKTKQKATETATAKRLEDKLAIKAPAAVATKEELESLTAKLAEHQARLDKFKGGIKGVMQDVKKNMVINAFKAAKTPDDAAIAIQARVRGRAAMREVSAKREAAIASNPQRSLLQRTAAYIQEREISGRLQALREQVRMYEVVEDAMRQHLGSGPPRVMPHASRR